MPNWLGDLLMAYPFISALKERFPHSEIDLICKANLCGLAELFPAINQVFPFSKETHGGLFGARKFVQTHFFNKKYQYFFCLPDSFSSAWMGRFVDAERKLGYAKEARSFLLSKAFPLPEPMHRSLKYLRLLELEFGNEFECDNLPFLAEEGSNRKSPQLDFSLLSFRSVAASRTLSLEKATTICKQLLSTFEGQFVFTGTASDRQYYEQLITQITAHGINTDRLENRAGRTDLKELLELMRQAKALLGVDSGTAHLANACGLPAVILFGAGDEDETGGIFETKQIRLRKKGLACAPCLSNTCQFSSNECINDLSIEKIIHQLSSL